MTGIRVTRCTVNECVSGFPYKDECGLIADGCAARRMLATAKQMPEGAHFPMDLKPGGNAFVNALAAARLVRVRGDLTFAVQP